MDLEQRSDRLASRQGKNHATKLRVGPFPRVARSVQGDLQLLPLVDDARRGGKRFQGQKDLTGARSRAQGPASCQEGSAGGVLVRVMDIHILTRGEGEPSECAQGFHPVEGNEVGDEELCLRLPAHGARTRGGRSHRSEPRGRRGSRDVQPCKAALLALHPSSTDARLDGFAEIRLVPYKEKRGSPGVLREDLPQCSRVEARGKAPVREGRVFQAQRGRDDLRGLECPHERAAEDQGDAKRKPGKRLCFPAHPGRALFGKGPLLVIALPLFPALRFPVAKKEKVHHAPPWLPRRLMSCACESTVSSPSARRGRA